MERRRASGAPGLRYTVCIGVEVEGLQGRAVACATGAGVEVEGLQGSSKCHECCPVPLGVLHTSTQGCQLHWRNSNAGRAARAAVLPNYTHPRSWASCTGRHLVQAVVGGDHQGAGPGAAVRRPLGPGGARVLGEPAAKDLKAGAGEPDLAGAAEDGLRAGGTGAGGGRGRRGASSYPAQGLPPQPAQGRPPHPVSTHGRPRHAPDQGEMGYAS